MYLVFMCFEYCCCVLIEAYFIAFWHKFGLFVNIFCPLEHMQQQFIFLEKNSSQNTSAGAYSEFEPDKIA